MVAAAPPPTTPARRSRTLHLAIGVGVVLAAVGVYVVSLLGYHWLADSSRPLAPPNLGTTADTVVVVNLVALHTADNRLDAKVTVLPAGSLMDQNLNVLNNDISVQLYPPTDFDDLEYHKGKTPADVNTTIAVTGNVNNWPFDSYSTQEISADVLVASGDQPEAISARVEVSGSLNGWAVHVDRSGPSTQDMGGPDNVTITLQRAKGPLVFDLGVCLVLISLPAMALFVSIETLRVRARFMPAYATWYTAMLFAIVPLRNILPGAPPPGAWIDQAIVLWALIALTLAMVLFIVAWHRSIHPQPDAGDEVEAPPGPPSEDDASADSSGRPDSERETTS